ncbi:phosphoadenylyl-sulfate reductase [Candidatus Vondammii sp. HM_W22]|uniref:phosphoadenylyl-sulfate reductase n=1 Tax=Candidatus Vondammii sp. HM_W22 TaxID=2687299 RepID=UPI001F14543E|nr:phosphoadenylyl-sulfate reductase [Candidatus Vondammii sp. HM_W22]
MDERELIEALLAGEQQALLTVNQQMEKETAEERVQWALQHLPGSHLLSSSFGIQGAVMLHLVTQAAPEIPVMLIDTGYLFSETYQFIDELTDRLQLNLMVYRAQRSASWQEALLGKLWEQGREGIERYNQINKVEPMQRALRDLEVGTWFAGLRREQSESRAGLPVLRLHDGRFKLHPIIDWSKRDVHHYLSHHSLPYHPLWEQGYVSVGDRHTSCPLTPGMLEEETRFFGLKRECGLHE